jgi:hypothetical protein
MQLCKYNRVPSTDAASAVQPAKPTPMSMPSDEAARPSRGGGRARGAAWLHGGWRAAHDIDPEFWRNLRHELLAGRQWLDRAVVLAFAAATGAVVVGFTLLAEAAIHGFRLIEGWGSTAAT